MLKKRIPILFLTIFPLLAAILLVSSLHSPTAQAAPAAPAASIHVDIPVSDITTGNVIEKSNTSRNVAVGANGIIYIAYHGTNGVRVARSIDGGSTFLPSVQLDTGNYEVEITVDLNHDVYATWSDGANIYVSRSTDDGVTFSPAVSAGVSELMYVHMDTDAPYVYIIDRYGEELHVSDDNGQTFITHTTGLPEMVFADVRVNKRNGEVFVLADDPQLYMARSIDNGMSFGTVISPTGTVYYSSYAASFSETDWYGFVSGNALAGNVGTEAYRIDFGLDASTPLTFGLSSPFQSRSLAIDNCGQVVDGYSDDSSLLYFATSMDLGDSFGAATTVSTGSDLSVSVNSVNGYVVTAYTGDDGQIYASVYDVGLAPCDAAGGRPVADSQVVTTTLNTALPITLTATDPDMDTLTYTVATSPTHGTLSGTVPNLVYTPDAGYVGTDSFTFYANDGTADSSPATIDINITTATSADTADLAISQSIGFEFLDTIFTIVAQNNGPDAAPGTMITVTTPAGINVAGWTCTASGGAVCPATSGSGNIPPQTVGTFPSGGSVTYVMTTSVSGTHANMVQIAPPTGVTDPDMSNNTSTQMSAYLIILPIIYNNATFTP